MKEASKSHCRESCGSGRRTVVNAEPLLVKDRPFAIGVVEHGAAAREAATLVDPPGGGMPIARLKNQMHDALAPRQRLDLAQDSSADAAALELGPGVHA